MPTDSPQPCTHARGPGTTVCLRCRAEERARAAARIKGRIARATAVVAVVVLGGVGLAGLVGRMGTGAESPPGELGTDRSVGVDAPADGTPVELAGDPPSSAADAPYAPLIDIGATELGDSVTALRRGDTVIVQFDTEMARTRRADKFDRMVRWTVPRIFGPSVGRQLPAVALARDGQLTATLPETGIHVRLEGGWILHVWPLTREGRDGPLITAYRAVIGR